MSISRFRTLSSFVAITPSHHDEAWFAFLRHARRRRADFRIIRASAKTHGPRPWDTGTACQEPVQLKLMIIIDLAPTRRTAASAIPPGRVCGPAAAQYARL